MYFHIYTHQYTQEKERKNTKLQTIHKNLIKRTCMLLMLSGALAIWYEDDDDNVDASTPSPTITSSLTTCTSAYGSNMSSIGLLTDNMSPNEKDLSIASRLWLTALNQWPCDSLLFLLQASTHVFALICTLFTLISNTYFHIAVLQCAELLADIADAVFVSCCC